MWSVVAEHPISDVTLSRAQVRDCRTLCCALILGAALLLPACEEGSTTPPAPTTTPAPTTPPAPAPQPPTAPANLRVSAAGEDFVEWSWNAVADATGYEVQFSRDAEFTEADEVIDVSGQTVYRREGLSAETSVYLRVRSYRETGDDRLRSGWTIVLPATTLVPAIPETIPDAGLRAAVTVALGKRAGDSITRGELSTLGELDARSAQIVDLTGLEWATGLRVLQLDTNSISDISPLAGLTGLEQLSLGQNSISDLSPLARLTGLEELSLYVNNISDLSPLAGLTGLELLYLGRNSIADLSPLAGLTGLEELSLYVNSISDISPLARLTGLKQLQLTTNDISDISPLARLRVLKWLDLRNNNISDISPLLSRRVLESLYLAGNNISDISPLARLTRLERLSLGRNNISDISPLARLTVLWYLHLEGNDISDISSLARLIRLGHLYLGNNNISDISPLVRLIRLRHLDLTSNNVTDLTPIAHLSWREGDVLYAGNNPLRRASRDLLLRLADAGVAVDYDLALEDEFPGSQLVQLIDDKVLAIRVPEDLTEKHVRNGLPLEAYAQEIYRWFADEFDYLVFLSNLSSIEDFNGHVYYGVYSPVMNDTEGTGRDIFFNSGPVPRASSGE